MQHFRLKALSALAIGLAAVSMPMSAEIIELENTMKFDINRENMEAVATYFMKYAFNNDGLVDLPDEIQWNDSTYKVVGIGSSACINNGGLVKLVLGKNIRYIADQAVYGSSALNEVVFNDIVESIGAMAFQNCSALSSIDLPASVKTIGDYAFMATGFESFTFPATVDSIGNNPFRAVTKLQTLDVAEGNPNYKMLDGALVTKDGKKLITLPAGNGLTEYTIPQGITLVGPHSVRNNPTLEKVTMLEGLTDIGEYAFGAMPKLTTVDIPASVTTIGSAAFYYNSSLTTVNVASGSPFQFKDGWFLGDGGKSLVFSLQQSGDVVIPEGIETLGELSMYYLSGMTSVTLPSTLKRIERSAFANNSNLTTVNFNEGLEYIGVSAFQSCGKLEKVILPSTVKTLDNQAFTYGYAINEVKLNQGLEKIGDMCFYSAYSFPELTIPGTVKEFMSWAFYNCQAIKTLVIEEGVTEVPGTCFYQCTGLESVSLPETITSIGSSAFSFCYSLTDINIPASVIEIGGAAFQSTAIEDFVLPEGVTIINDFTFASMKSLKSLKLNDNIIRIENNGIHANDLMENIDLGSKLEYIGDKGVSLNGTITQLVFPQTLVGFGQYAINYNISMTDLYVMNPVPVELEYDFFDPEAYAFKGYEEITLHVPEGTLDDYLEAPIWNKFLTIVDDVYDPTQGLKDSLNGVRVISKKYYDLNGNAVANPVYGQVYLKKMVLENGRVVTDKVIGE